jgi:hypothetical protein
LFDLATKRTAWIEVKFRGLKSEGDALGVPFEHIIDMEVELIDREEFNRLFIMPDEVEEPEAFAAYQAITNLEKITRVAINWRKIKFGGNPADFSEENLARMLNVPNFINGFNLAYGTKAARARMGDREARVQINRYFRSRMQDDGDRPRQDARESA